MTGPGPWGGPTRTQADLNRFASAQGQFSDVDDLYRFSYDPAVDGTERVVWAGGNTIAYTFLTTAAPLRLRDPASVTGSSSNDDAAGTGARAVTLLMIDDAGVPFIETLATTNSGASAATSGSAYRLQRAFCGDGGTYTTTGLDGSNDGTIVIETTGGVAVGVILAGVGQTQQSIYTVPAGVQAHLAGFAAEVDGSASARCTFRMWQRRSATTTSAPVLCRRLVDQWPGVGQIPPTPLIGKPDFPPLTDLWVTASKDGGGAAVATNFRYGLEFRPYGVTGA